MNSGKRLWMDTDGGAVVEATILFPIILMIFAGLCLLAVYLPTRANLQRATQFAADVMATQASDTWIRYNPNDMKYNWLHSHKDTGISNVYLALFSGFVNNEQSDYAAVEKIVKNMEQKGIYIPVGDLEFDYKITNFVVYKELHVTATRKIKSPVDLSFVGFPTEISVTVTSSSVVLNGDEFVRNIDLVKDAAENLGDMIKSLNDLGSNDTTKGAFNVTEGSGNNSISLAKEGNG